MNLFRKAFPILRKVRAEDTSVILFDGRGTKAYQANLADLSVALAEYATPVAAADVNTWEIPSAAFVNPSTGDDLTAELGNGNKPYATIAAAQAAASLVFLQPDDSYTEGFALQTGKTYYAYPGVVFTDGGITNTGSTLVNTKFLGYAKFTGNFNHIRLNGGTFTNVDIEFDSMEQTAGSALLTLYVKASTVSTLNIKCNSILDLNGGNGTGVIIQGPISGIIKVTEYIRCSYGTILLGTAGNMLQDFTIECPRIETPDGGGFGNLDPYKYTVSIGGVETGYTLTINANIYNLVSVALGNITAGIYCHNSGAGTVNMNGNIYGLKTRGIIMTNSQVKLIMRGSIITENSAFETGTTTATGQLAFNGCTLVHGAANKVLGSAKVWINNTTLYSTAGDIIDHTTSTAQLVITNTAAQGTVGEFVNTGGAARAVGTVNVVSNLSNDAAMTNLYATSGFTQDNAIVTPDFI